MPSVQLLLKDFIADLCQIFERLLIGFPLWQQIYGRFQRRVSTILRQPAREFSDFPVPSLA